MSTPAIERVEAAIDFDPGIVRQAVTQFLSRTTCEWLGADVETPSDWWFTISLDGQEGYEVIVDNLQLSMGTVTGILLDFSTANMSYGPETSAWALIDVVNGEMRARPVLLHVTRQPDEEDPVWLQPDFALFD